MRGDDYDDERAERDALRREQQEDDREERETNRRPNEERRAEFETEVRSGL